MKQSKSKSTRRSNNKKTNVCVAEVLVRDIPSDSEDSALSASEDEDEYAQLAASRRTTEHGIDHQPQTNDQLSRTSTGKRPKFSYK